jgi:hypothetical protein
MSNPVAFANKFWGKANISYIVSGTEAIISPKVVLPFLKSTKSFSPKDIVAISFSLAFLAEYSSNSTLGTSLPSTLKVSVELSKSTSGDTEKPSSQC